ncbi:RelA/SpoT domain-containing protein [Shewanella profunda]|uniref:RelA/SpoT domain-containing protein n=1 Tax=Shewanella profunda TaxID=254793 RepID=UPI00200FCFF2|nr:RelA/SpoT domain-containing protein [Shewanella profunda]MCL1088113.1 RelA/SpoT domain-containing protein [Shewanella profunda]
MNKLFRTFFIFLLLLSSRATVANALDISDTKTDRSNYSARQAQSHDIQGLYALSSQTFDTPLQTSTDLANLYSRAYEAQAELSQLLQQIATQSQAHIIIPAVKSYQRAADKVATKFNGDASQITDLARASIVTDSIQELMQAYQVLSEQTQVIRQKNRFATPKASGYRDLNLLVRLPQSGMIAEVQLHLQDIADIKNGSEHEVYEKVQMIEANAIKQQRPLSEFELAQITQLRQESHKLYHKAWLNYKRVDEASLLRVAVA